MAKKKDDKLDLRTKVATGVAFGDTSNSAVRNILTEISKELYGAIENDQLYETMEFFGWECPYTGKNLKPLIEKGLGGYAADHIYPQNKNWCGLNVQGNLVIVSSEANTAKRGLDVETFLLTDTKALKDLDRDIRQERLDKIKEFQEKYEYDPMQVRDIVRPIMEERYKAVREEQEKCIRDVMEVLEANGIKPTVTKSADAKSTSYKGEETGYTYSEKLAVAVYYLMKSETLVQVEENHMHLSGRNGATAKYILNRLGIDTSKKSVHKGLMARDDFNMDDEIAKASGAFKITLEEIKRRGLCD